jgi:hypothetical protein
MVLPVPVRQLCSGGQAVIEQGLPQAAVGQREIDIGCGQSLHRRFGRGILRHSSGKNRAQPGKGARVHLQDQVVHILIGVVKRPQRAARRGCHLARLKPR